MMQLSESDRQLLREARVGRLSTAGADGMPQVIPCCYVYDGGNIYTPLDGKPKRAGLRRLRRVRNIQANPQAALVVDCYDEDWSRLRYILVSGAAELLTGGPECERAIALLREKYPQYRQMNLQDCPVIKLTPRRLTPWRYTPPE